MPKTDFSHYIQELLRFIDRNADDKDEFNRLALLLFQLQFDSVPIFQAYCKNRGVSPASAAHWKQIPALPTTAFKEAEVTSLTEGERTCVFHSSGTTQARPGRHFHSSQSLEVYEASLLPWFRASVLDGAATASLRFIALTPDSIHAPHSSLVHMFETIRRACFSDGPPRDVFCGEICADGSWSMNLGKAARMLEEAVETPVLLMGTAFSFVHLLDHLEALNVVFRLPEGSRILETGGYKGRSREMPKEELHRLLAKFLGVPERSIVAEYGMSELSSQAYDLRVERAELRGVPFDRQFRFPPWARVQIVSPETGLESLDGEPGLLRIFDLANVRSVFAIQTEDLASRCGAAFKLLGRALSAEPRGCSLQLA